MHFLAILEEFGETFLSEALDSWYGEPKLDYDEFARKFPVRGQINNQTVKVKEMADWCERENIQFTPTFFVDGYELPEVYGVDDLKYFFSI